MQVVQDSLLVINKGLVVTENSVDAMTEETVRTIHGLLKDFEKEVTKNLSGTLELERVEPLLNTLFFVFKS